MNDWKKELWFLFAIFLALFIYFPEIFLLKAGFVSGDHRAQHYPWAFFAQQEFHNGRLPWWTSLIQCGFPLLAEGQVGALYPPNWFFYLLLPIRAAYNYEVLFHYALGGCLFFAYVRQAGIQRWGAFFATLVYVFGSAHAGFFYNMTSQRVTAWFPLSLLLMDRLFQNPRLLWALLLGAVFALESLAGYQQIAVYAIGFAALYFAGYLFSERRQISRAAAWRLVTLWGVALGFSFLLALPQWMAFLELTQFSSRRDAVEAFAYVGSTNPLGVLALFFPRWGGFLNAKLYVGILTLFFIGISFVSRKSRHEGLMIFLALLGILLALGKFSPLYVLLVKATHFYGFRIPSKFLYFVSFSLAVLSGFGFEKCFRARHDPEDELSLRKAKWAFAGFLGLGAAALLLGSLVLRVAKQPLMAGLESYVRTHIYGSPVHPHSLETYLAKLNSMVETVVLNVNPSHGWILEALAFMAVSLLAVFLFSRRAIKAGWARALVLLITFGDLWGYGFNSIKGDYEAFAFVEGAESPLIQQLKQDRGTFRIYEFYPEVKEKDRFPFAANDNMIHGLSDVGIYSPLAFKQYKRLMSPFGAVDDSLFVLPAESQTVLSRQMLLNYLNVKYLLSQAPLDRPSLELVSEEKGIKLYRNHDAFARAFFINRARWSSVEEALAAVSQPGFEFRREVILTATGGEEEAKSRERATKGVVFQYVEVLLDRQQEIELEGNFPEGGYVVLSDTHYPGWKAWVNGKETPIYQAYGLFRAVKVGKGFNRISMAYRPKHLYAALMVSFVSLLCFAILLFWQRIRSR